MNFLKVAADDEQFVLVGDMYAGVFPHVAKMVDSELTRYPKNSNPYSSNIWGYSGPPILKRTAKHIFVWVTKGTAESNSEQILETQEACFGLASCHIVPTNHP